MDYSVWELQEKLDDKISKLGIDEKFKENPAYDSALSEIQEVITQMNIPQENNEIIVSEKTGSIAFEWTSEFGDSYSLRISSSKPNSFRCVQVEEQIPPEDKKEQVIRKKVVVEKIATIDEAGNISLVTNGAVIHNINCPSGKYNNSTWAEKKMYTSNGVMCNREYKSFPDAQLTGSLDEAIVDSLLFIPRQAFVAGFWDNKYETHTFLVRDKLDTAKIVFEDKINGIMYRAITPLNQEHGLRDMELLPGYEHCPQDIVISPLSQEQIDAMIQRENNPKIQEGLKSYAVDRDVYSYDSKKDKNFYLSTNLSEEATLPQEIKK